MFNLSVRLMWNNHRFKRGILK